MIELKQIKKVYEGKRGKVTALKEINLTVNAGEIYGIIGYSGAGKSTLIRLINMLEKPTEGEIWVNGLRMDRMKYSQLRIARQQIGMIFQHFNLLWSRTVSENIAFPLEIAGVPKDEIDVRVTELIDLVGLSDKANSYPSELSGGQKQRVGIARALANRPKVLLSDEATSALDPKTTDSILTLLEEINKKLGITIILITHEMHVIQKICHRVAIIDNGEIVEEGPVIELFTHPKKEITKEFVKQVTIQHFSETTHLYEVRNQGLRETDRLVTDKLGTNRKATNKNATSKQVLKCTFLGDKANQSIISKWIKALDVEVNILEGNIQNVQGYSYGTLVIEVDVPVNQLEASLQFLESYGVEIEVI